MSDEPTRKIDVRDPVQARFVADWMAEVSSGTLGVTYRDEFTHAGHYHLIKQYADRIQDSQENAAREQAVEKAARMIVDRVYGFSWGEAEESERAASETIARALADAGLLNTRHGEA